MPSSWRSKHYERRVIGLKTFQDFEKARGTGGELEFIKVAINEYRGSEEYRIAVDADEYEAEHNVTIMEFLRLIYNAAGEQTVDFTAANNKIASNFLHRLTTQRVAYSLGNGVSFASAKREQQDGEWKTVDSTKEN